MLQIDKYTALNLDSYDGKNGEVFSLIEGFVGREGDFKNTWVTEKFGKDREEKVLPKRVKIGDRAKVIEVALWLLEEITGKDYVPLEVKEQDIPF